MKRRLYLLIVLLVAVAASVIFVAVRRSREFYYHGKPVRAWAIAAYNHDAQAAVAFQALGAKAVPFLTNMLFADDSFIRREAWAIGPKVSREMRSQLITKVGVPDPGRLHVAAARSLGLIGPPAREAIPALLKALHDPDQLAVWEAATALGLIGREAVPSLVETLQDTNAGVRAASAFALGKIGAAAELGAPALVKGLMDTNEMVRNSAAYSLTQIGTPALTAMAEVIERGSAEARTAAAKALVEYNIALRGTATSLVKMAHDPSPTARQQALETLGAIRAQDGISLKAMRQALADPAENVRLAAIKVLSSVNWKAHAAVPELITCTRDDSAAVREWSARTLGNIGPSAKVAMPDLKRLSEDKEEPVRVAAREAIGKLEQY